MASATPNQASSHRSGQVRNEACDFNTVPRHVMDLYQIYGVTDQIEVEGLMNPAKQRRQPG
jgi:hypothetical protein